MLLLCLGNRDGNSNYEVGYFSCYFLKIRKFHRENDQVAKRFFHSTDFCFRRCKVPCKTSYRWAESTVFATLVFSSIVYGRPNSKKQKNWPLKGILKRLLVFSHRQFPFQKRWWRKYSSFAFVYKSRISFLHMSLMRN